MLIILTNDERVREWCDINDVIRDEIMGMNIHHTIHENPSWFTNRADIWTRMLHAWLTEKTVVCAFGTFRSFYNEKCGFWTMSLYKIDVDASIRSVETLPSEWQVGCALQPILTMQVWYIHQCRHMCMSQLICACIQVHLQENPKP